MLTNIDVPRLESTVSFESILEQPRSLLDFSLLQVVHVDVDPICGNLAPSSPEAAAHLPSPSMPVDIMMGVLGRDRCGKRR